MRFRLCEDSNGWFSIFDNEDVEDEPLLFLSRHYEMIGVKEVTDLLNEQQATITKLRNENIILKNKIKDLRGSLIIQNELLQRQMQKSDLDE